MRCHSGPSGGGGRWASSRLLASASWTRFSPTIRRPARQASSTAAAGCVLPTPTRMTSAAGRPARAQAVSIRTRISARRSAMPLTGPHPLAPSPISLPPPAGRGGTLTRELSKDWSGEISPLSRGREGWEMGEGQGVRAVGGGVPRSGDLSRLLLLGFEIEDPLATVALHHAGRIADLHDGLRSHPIVAGAAMPLALPAPRPFDGAYRREGGAGIAVEDAVEHRELRAGDLAAQRGDPGAQLFHLVRDGGLLRLPARQLRLVALVQLAEALALLRQLLLRLLAPLEGRQRLFLEAGDLRLDGVDLLEQRAVLALGADPVDLLLVFLQLFLRILAGRLGRAALVARGLRGLARGFRSRPGGPCARRAARASSPGFRAGAAPLL